MQELIKVSYTRWAVRGNSGAAAARVASVDLGVVAVAVQVAVAAPAPVAVDIGRIDRTGRNTENSTLPMPPRCLELACQLFKIRASSL